MFEVNDKDIILKMDLIDTISEERDSINFIDLRNETDYLFDILKEGYYIGNNEYDYTYLEMCISNAKISYKLNPDMNMSNRIPFIKGMDFATQFLAYCEEKNNFKKLSLEQKIDLSIKTYKEVKKDLNLNLTGKDNYYFKNGIEAIIKIIHSSNKKKKK